MSTIQNIIMILEEVDAALLRASKDESPTFLMFNSNNKNVSLSVIQGESATIVNKFIQRMESKELN